VPPLKNVLYVNITLFSLVLLLHLTRLLTGFSVRLGSWDVPLWVNAFGALLAAVLLYANYSQLK